MKGSFALPSGRFIETKTKLRYIVVSDDIRSGGPPYVLHYSNAPGHCDLAAGEVLIDTEAGERVR